MKKWLCIVCGWIYDEAKGWPADGIAPGTRWEDIPDDWQCPDCGVAKSDFEMLEISAAVAVENINPVATQEAPIVIIGSGYAGYQLAQGIRQRNADRAIVIYTADDGANYSKPNLSNALTREQSPQDLISETLLEVEQRLNIRIHGHCKVQSIDSQQHTITTDFGQQSYSKLIFATGASPIKLPFAGNLPEQGAQDVFSINNLQDYHRFRDKLDTHPALNSNKGLQIAIIGNGLIGCEFANDLSNQGHKVSVIGLTAWPMDRLIPQKIGEQLAQNLAEQGVQWYLQNSVKNIDKIDSGYQLSLATGEIIEADLVISAIGLAPRIELAKAAGVNCERGIIVNGGLRTNVADIYALGDCAQINGQLLPYIAPINHSVTALADCLLGKPRMAIYPLMPVLVKTPALPLTILNPPAKANEETKGEWQVEETTSGIRAFFKDSSGNLLGFALSGDTTQQRQQWLDKLSQ